MATKTTKRRMMTRMMVMMMLLRMRTMMMMISREDKIDQGWLTSNQRLYIGWPARDSPLSSCLSDLSLILGIKFLLLIIIIVIFSSFRYITFKLEKHCQGILSVNGLSQPSMFTFTAKVP